MGFLQSFLLLFAICAIGFIVGAIAGYTRNFIVGLVGLGLAVAISLGGAGWIRREEKKTVKAA